MQCDRWLLSADGEEAEQCGADVTGRLCAAGHQPYQPDPRMERVDQTLRWAGLAFTNNQKEPK